MSTQLLRRRRRFKGIRNPQACTIYIPCTVVPSRTLHSVASRTTPRNKKMLAITQSTNLPLRGRPTTLQMPLALHERAFKGLCQSSCHKGLATQQHLRSLGTNAPEAETSLQDSLSSCKLLPCTPSAFKKNLPCSIVLLCSHHLQNLESFSHF